MKAKKAIKAFNMLKEGKSDEEILEFCSRSTLKKVRAVFNKKKENGEELVLEKYPQKSKKTEEITIKETPNEKVISLEGSDLKTLDDLIAYSNINTDDFMCTEFTSSVYGKKENPSIQCKGVFKPKVESPIALKEQVEIFKNLVENFVPKHYNKTYENGEYAAILPIADLHFGSRSVKEEVGEEYNLEKSREVLIDSMLFHKEHIFKYNIDKIIIPVLGDFFNVDNTSSSTTRGTFQEETTSLKRTFRKGYELFIEVIEMFRDLSPVEVFICRGNHDEKNSFYLQCYLEAFYKNSDVLIDSSDKLMKYVRYGNTCLGFGHGDTNASADYLSIMLSDTSAFDSKYREFFIGHLHHVKTEERPGIKIRRTGSLCSSDTWHKKKGYNSLRSSEGYIVSKEKGVVCNTTYYV